MSKESEAGDNPSSPALSSKGQGTIVGFNVDIHQQDNGDFVVGVSGEITLRVVAQAGDEGLVFTSEQVENPRPLASTVIKMSAGKLLDAAILERWDELYPRVGKREAQRLQEQEMKKAIDVRNNQLRTAAYALLTAGADIPEDLVQYLDESDRPQPKGKASLKRVA
jgi:hypothetical protein